MRPGFGGGQLAGGALVLLGGALGAWCVASFATAGRGTPAPFDPPRRLVIVGPYRYVRNPMYVGAGLALAGVALVYRSTEVFGYLVLLGLFAHALIVFYEEPVLGRTFGAEYAAYCRRVGRWLPKSGGRRRGGVGSAAVGTVYDMLNEDKRRAVEVIVEGRAAATDPETADERPPGDRTRS